MVVDERSRLLLHARLEELLGHDEATTLMEHLPPVGWADVATRSDLEQTANVLRTEIGAAEDRLRGHLHQAMAAQTRTFVLALMGAMTSSTGLAFAAARLGL